MKKNLIFNLLMMFLLLNAGIGCAQQPSQSDVEEAVNVKLKQHIPKPWIGNRSLIRLGGDNDFSINRIEIIEWGEKQEIFGLKSKVWPAKIRVVGDVKIWDAFANKKGIKNFDNNTEVYFYNNEFGKWKMEFLNMKDNI